LDRLFDFRGQIFGLKVFDKATQILGHYAHGVGVVPDYIHDSDPRLPHQNAPPYLVDKNLVLVAAQGLVFVVIVDKVTAPEELLPPEEGSDHDRRCADKVFLRNFVWIGRRN
jgi:hypothetical protein